MSSIDDLFKRPNAPNAGVKRKLEAPPKTLEEARKAAKTAVNRDAKGKEHASVEVEPPEDDDEDVGAGPELPPDDDEEAGPEPEDEEGGRFFGGGTNKHTNDALDYIESQEGEYVEPEKIDNTWLRRTIRNFQQKINKNTELRSKYADDAMKFMDSEGDLDEAIKDLSVISDHPELYLEMVKTGGVNSLVQLLLHENTDIALNAIQILGELTDEDVPATEEQWTALMDAMLEAEVVDLVLSVVQSLDEEKEEDRAGVYRAMEFLENLCSRADTLETILEGDSEDKLLKYLLDRVQKDERPTSQNKQYACELLSIVASQSTTDGADTTAARQRLLKLNAMDTLLQLLAPYRKHDPPKDTDDEQLIEDTFDTLNSLVASANAKPKLVEAEGIELLLIIVREGGKLMKAHTLRLLDYAMSGSSLESIAVSERLVEAVGLKPIFKTFSSIAEKKDRESLEHALNIIASLLRCLPGNSAARVRALAKFTEKKHEKINTLIRLRNDYDKRLENVEKRIDEEKQATKDPEERELKEIDWITRRLDAGLPIFQTITVILAWLFAEDDGAATKIRELMTTTMSLTATLTEQLESVEKDSEDENNSKEMLQTLIDCLQ